MLDATALSIGGFALAKVVLWLAVGFIVLAVCRRIYRDAQPTTESEDSSQKWGDSLSRNWLQLSFGVLLLVLAIGITQSEMGFRPKTVIQPANVELQQELRALDQTPAPVIAPAEGDLEDAANADYSDENRRTNEAARDRFRKLPE